MRTPYAKFGEKEFNTSDYTSKCTISHIFLTTPTKHYSANPQHTLTMHFGIKLPLQTGDTVVYSNKYECRYMHRLLTTNQ